MPASAKSLGKELDGSLARLSGLVGRATELHQANALTTRQFEAVLAGIAVLAHAEVEGFIDRLFLGLLAGAVRPNNRSRVKPLIRAKSYEHARSVVLGRDASGAYVSWLPYHQTLDHAKRLFRGGRPFSDMRAPTQQALFQLHHVRNALAHNSNRSREMFRKHCIGDRALPNWQLRPAGFLRGLHSGGSLRISHYLGELRVGLIETSRNAGESGRSGLLKCPEAG